MERYFRIIAYTPYCGEEFTGYCGIKEGDEDRLHEFADLLVAENAEEHLRDHVDSLLDEDTCDDYYEGCGARFEEIDYDTFMDEAFEDYEREGDWV